MSHSMGEDRKCSMLRRTFKAPKVSVTVSPILYMEPGAPDGTIYPKEPGWPETDFKLPCFRSTKPFWLLSAIPNVILGSITSLSNALAMVSTSKTR